MNNDDRPVVLELNEDLAKDIDVAISYAESSDLVPDSWIDNIIVLHIDTNKLDKSKFRIDQNVQDNEGDTLEYAG